MLALLWIIGMAELEKRRKMGMGISHMSTLLVGVCC